MIQALLYEKMQKELPVYKMTMKMLNKKVNAASRYKESPTEYNLNALRKANDDSLKIQRVINKSTKNIR